MKKNNNRDIVDIKIEEKQEGELESPDLPRPKALSNFSSMPLVTKLPSSPHIAGKSPMKL